MTKGMTLDEARTAATVEASLPVSQERKEAFKWVLRADPETARLEASELLDDLKTLRTRLERDSALGQFKEPPEQILLSLVTGHVPPKYGSERDFSLSPETMAHLNETNPTFVRLSHRFGELEITSRMADKAFIRGDDAMQTLIEDALLERKLLDKFYEHDKTSFEEAISREVAQLSWRLKHMDNLVGREGVRFDAKEVFETMALGKGQVLMNAPLVVPDTSLFDHYDSLKDRWPWMMSFGASIEQRIAGYTFRFGFAERKVESDVHVTEKDDGKRSVWYPVVAIDRVLLERLLDAAKLADDAFAGADTVRKASAAILTSVRALTNLGSHDYVHGMIYSVKPTLDEQGQLKARTSFTNVHSAVTAETFDPSTISGQWSAASKQNYSGASVETFSALMNFEVFQEAFQKQPQVRTAILRNAGTYLENVNTLKSYIEATEGAEEAEKSASYLAILGLSQVELIIALDRSKLSEKKDIEMFDRIVAEVERLQLKPYVPDLGEIAGRFSALEFGSYEEMSAIVYNPENSDPPELSARQLDELIIALRHGSQGIDHFPSHEEARGMAKALWYAGARLGGIDFSPSNETRENLEAMKRLLSSGEAFDSPSTRILGELVSLGLKPGTEQWKGAAALVASNRGLESNVVFVGVVQALLDPSEHDGLIKAYLKSRRAALANDSERPMLEKVRNFYDGPAVPLEGWAGFRMRLDVEGYRPPWIHWYERGGTELSEAGIAADFYKALKGSGLRETAPFRRALAAYLGQDE